MPDSSRASYSDFAAGRAAGVWMFPAGGFPAVDTVAAPCAGISEGLVSGLAVPEKPVGRVIPAGPVGADGAAIRLNPAESPDAGEGMRTLEGVAGVAKEDGDRETGDRACRGAMTSGLRLYPAYGLSSGPACMPMESGLEVNSRPVPR